MSRRLSESLPPQPLLNYCRMRGYESTEEQATWLGVSEGSIRNWALGRNGIRSNKADKLACGIGVHPCMIWGELWFDEKYHPLEQINGRTIKRETL